MSGNINYNIEKVGKLQVFGKEDIKKIKTNTIEDGNSPKKDKAIFPACKIATGSKRWHYSDEGKTSSTSSIK